LNWSWSFFVLFLSLCVLSEESAYNLVKC
jgi:hypothetical protein